MFRQIHSLEQTINTTREICEKYLNSPQIKTLASYDWWDIWGTSLGSFGKKLKHLPLEISLDIGKEKDSPGWIRLGGIFALNHGLQLRWGTSSDKLKQKTGINITEDYLGSTGLGISYSYNQFNFDLSGYFFGTGGWISGISLTILL